jgi:methyl-accepting chemotaxis protein
MATVNIEPQQSDAISTPTGHDHAIDTARRIAHLAQETQELGSLAADAAYAIEEAVRAAKRAIKSVEHTVEELGDSKDKLANKVKGHRLKAVALGVGVTLVLGVAVSWMLSRQPR